MHFILIINDIELLKICIIIYIIYIYIIITIKQKITALNSHNASIYNYKKILIELFLYDGFHSKKIKFVWVYLKI